MQLKTEPKPKDNLGTSRENTKEILPIDQWDAVAFRMIRQELAPKGYSEIKRGPWRGKVQSNIPFLHKQTVERCQQIAAQMVRSYRQKAIKELELKTISIQEEKTKWEGSLKNLSFWQWKQKDQFKRRIADYEGQLLALGIAVVKLQDLSIK